MLWILNINRLLSKFEIRLVKYSYQTFSEVTSYSTPAKLIAPGVVVPGTLSITATDLFFDADEENPLYKKQDPRVNYPALKGYPSGK
ncbi:unnamed protein product [Strongylus vulgaris]|uniref:BEACH-type PH domain-containing protein n=1 Tax=Strongylus vulgaris TaxID=40348 RepID=A0A3P7IHJ4_STRVU|nr:unnamed protein product [Strongylus vulgaris]